MKKKIFNVTTTLNVVAPIALMIMSLIGLKKLRLRKENGMQEEKTVHLDGGAEMPKCIIGDMGGALPDKKIAVEFGREE